LYLGIEVKKLMLNLYQENIFSTRTFFLLLTKNLQITDLNFKKNFYNLALLKHALSAFLLMD